SGSGVESGCYSLEYSPCLRHLRSSSWLCAGNVNQLIDIQVFFPSFRIPLQGLGRGAGSIIAGKRNNYPCSLFTQGSRIAEELDVAAEVLDDAVDQREAKPRTLAGVLGGEE